MRLLAFAASRRKASLNRRLLTIAVAHARAAGAEVDVAEFAELDVPLYDGDLQAEGMPEAVTRIGARIAAADGLLIATPEYNYSIPGTLKNLIDWMSRLQPMPLRGKHGALLAASGGPIGGIRGLWQARIPLEGLGVTLLPDMFALANAREAFDDQGGLKDPQLARRLEKLVRAYVEMGRKLGA